MKMDHSIEDDDCAIETVVCTKKKKLRQAPLQFGTIHFTSPNSANNRSIKRKEASPLEERKNPKLIKYSTKENSKEDGSEDGENSEEKMNDKLIEIILDEDEQDNQVHEKNKQITTTPKRRSLGKNKKLDKSQNKPGALTKFFKKTDKTVVNSIKYDNLCESRNKQDCQNMLVNKEMTETCNENQQSVESISYSMTQINKSSGIDVADKNAENCSPCIDSDFDVNIISSDNETLSELDRSMASGNEQKTSQVSATSETNESLKKKRKKLTAKELQKRQEIVRRKEERTKLKMEKEKKREEEKANRQKEKQEKQREKEEKERIEKEQRKREKELKELKKQTEIEQKQKEKEAKEEERRKREEAKEEEKKRKEEEKLEAKRKKQKAASNFASFFVSKKQDGKSGEEESIVKSSNFMPFEIKADMRIAPLYRRILDQREKLLLDKNIQHGEFNVDVKSCDLYLKILKNEPRIPRTSGKTWPIEAKDDDIFLLDEDNDGSSNIIKETHNLERHRPKLLQFYDNRRPPYWGTWRKLSNVINSRRPFTQDKKWFDYEVDSDEEWEEEEPGESLKGSDDEKDEENSEDNEYDVDNEFMVPHGYLSDEEAQADEEETQCMTPQTQKMKLKLLGEQFEAERNAKTHKLKPKIIGCIWQDTGHSFSASVPSKVKEFLSVRLVWVSHIPVKFPTSGNDIEIDAECTSAQQQSGRNTKKPKIFPDTALPDLIRLVHGNTYSRRFLMKEFMTFWNRTDEAGEHQLSKTSVLQKINELANKIACPEEGPMHLKSCWYVPEDIRKRYFPSDDLTLPNRWTYILTPRQKNEAQDVIDKAEKEEKEKEKEKRHAPLITQFTKKITQEEMKRQLPTKTDQVLAVTPKLPPLQRPPKRATLISVGRGEPFPEKSSKNILAKFNAKKEKSSSNEEIIDSDEDEVIFVQSIDKN